MTDKNHNTERLHRPEAIDRIGTVSNSLNLITSIIYNVLGEPVEEQTTYYDPTQSLEAIDHTGQPNASIYSPETDNSNQMIEFNPISAHIAYVNELTIRANKERGLIND
jgi:hypothetical protein